jgi:hypothetical protein
LGSEFITRDTVMGDTPAWRATSWMVTTFPLRRALFLATSVSP